MTDIKQKTKIGILWNITEKILVQLISFVLNIILARLLCPEDYGTIGLLTVFISFSDVLIDSGFSKALIQKQDREEKDFSTILIFNVLISLLIYVVLFFCSPAIASFYKKPELLTLERVFFIVIVLNSLTVVQNAQLQIKVDFKKIALINSLTTLLSGVLGIIAAYYGLSYWALVIQSLSKSFISTVLYWSIGRWIPRTGFNIQSFKSLFNYGSKLLLSGILSSLIINITDLIIGKLYSPESLGYYTRAAQFPVLIAGTVISVLSVSTFPLLSSLQKDTSDLKSIHIKLLKITSFLIFPALIGLATISKPLILVLLGDKWSESIVLMFWLSLGYIFSPIGTLNINVLNAIGKSDTSLKLDLIKVPILIVILCITLPLGVKAVVIGKFINYIIGFFINGFMIGKLFNYGPIKQLFSIWKYILSSTVMGVAVYLIAYFIPSNLIGLIVGVFSGVAIYMLMLLILKDELYLDIWKKIIGKFKHATPNP